MAYKYNLRMYPPLLPPHTHVEDYHFYFWITRIYNVHVHVSDTIEVGTLVGSYLFVYYTCIFLCCEVKAHPLNGLHLLVQESAKLEECVVSMCVCVCVCWL